MKIVIVENSKELGKKAFEEIKSVLGKNPEAVLGLATGSTPLPLYAEMIADHKAGGISYKETVTFNLDEYVGLPAEHPQSYISFMKTNLFDHIDIDMSNVNIPCGTAADVNAECERYSKKLSERTVDLQVLGIGGNGHIAFNEPNTPLNSLTHITTLKEKTIADNARFFESADEVPRFALTMGIGEIMRAKKILLLATGEGKAEAVYNMIKGVVSVACPASVLQRHQDMVCILDNAAAKLII